MWSSVLPALHLHAAPPVVSARRLQQRPRVLALAPPRSAIVHGSSSAPTDSSSAEAGTVPSSAELLRARGVTASALQSAVVRCPELLGRETAHRVEPILQLLAQEGFSEPQQIELLLLKCPQMPTYCIAKAEASLAFLSESLGLDRQQRADVVRRFPQVLGYGVKSWLLPQLAFLRSLGVHDLPTLVLARPQVLGSSILLVTRWLTRCVKTPRAKVGQVLAAYPFDYSPAFATGLRKYVATQIQAEAARARDEDEDGEGEGEAEG